MDMNCTMIMFMPETFYSGDYKLYFSELHLDSWNADTDGKKAGAIICLLVMGIVMYGVLFLYKLALEYK